MADAYKSAVNRTNALSRWSKTEDRTAATKSWRDGFLARLRTDVLSDFPGLTDENEIENQVQRRLKLHYERMRANSLKTRRSRKQAEQADEIDAMLDELADGAA
jgi:hypothetical protein